MEIRLNELKDVIMKDEWQREQQLAAGCSGDSTMTMPHLFATWKKMSKKY